MANLEAIVEWPGLDAIESCAVTQSHGVTPSVFSITCFPQKKSPTINGDLKIKYDNFTRTFEDCLIDGASYQLNASGEIIGLTLFDWRWRWRGGAISGRYNERKISGELDDSFYEVKSIRELAKLCTDKLNHNGAELDELPNNEYPAVSWDYENPAMALQSLCEICSCRVVPLKGNKIKVCKAGVGAQLNNGLPYEGISEAIDLVDPYDSIEVVGAPIIIGVTYPLEGVLQVDENDSGNRYWFRYGSDDNLPSWVPSFSEDPEGITIPIGNSFGYRRRGYWLKSRRKWLEPAILENGQEDSFVWGQNWRTSVASGCKFVKQAGLKDELDDYRLALPVIQEISSLAIDDADFDLAAKAYQPVVNGSFYDDREKGDQVSDTDVPVPFSIEQSDKHLLVKFAERVSGGGEGSEAPVLQLFAAANILNPKTKTHIRYTYKQKFTEPKNGKENTLVLRRDDIVLYHGNDEALNKKVLAECDKRAKFYIDAKIKELQNRNPQTQIVAGWADQALDGAIQAVEWTMDSGGASMTIHRNDDPGTSTTVSYAERQANMKQRETFLVAGFLKAVQERERKAVR
jgi:hypothetical protein